MRTRTATASLIWLLGVACGELPPGGPTTSAADDELAQRSSAVTLEDDDDGAGEGPAPQGEAPCQRVDLGHQTLASDDGWASVGTGTTGGALATAEETFVVKTRAELIAALNDGVPATVSAVLPSNQPKIIYVDGTIDFNVDDTGLPLACPDYYRDGFTLEAFLAAFDPATWGRGTPAGALETSRIVSRNAQQDRVRMRVGSNTTLVGLGRHAALLGVWLDLRGTPNVAGSRTNIIIRNLSFQDTYDCFPQWSPTDGALGNWNAQYDAISLRDTDHVWIDGNSFEDRRTADELAPAYFGVLFQVHDGLLDITNASDQVTASWNRFRNHSKAMLIGSSDTALADRGKLRVTLHHNRFEALGQRTPRVRFGQVHVYNNLYQVRDPARYLYSWGVGIESALYAENNFFDTGGTVAAGAIISRFNGTTLYETGTLLDGSCDDSRVDPVASWNALNEPDLTNQLTWTPPTPPAQVQPTREVPDLVRRRAGRASRARTGLLPG